MNTPPPAPTVVFPGGETRPALGLGTWNLGEARSKRAAEVAALRGGVPGLAREALFVTSKVLPQHASAAGVVAACERSLARLKLDRIDLYLLHWRGSVPLADTLRGFETLQRRGLIRHWGVSNFDSADLQELFALPGGAACAANQVYYALEERGPAFELLPWQQAHSMPLQAYCPLGQGALARAAGLADVADRHGATPAQVALAWLLRQRGVMPLPKAVKAEHLRQNWAAQALELDAQDLQDIDRHFPPPRRRQPLAMR